MEVTREFMIDITDDEFRQMAGFIKQNYGIYLKDEKKMLLKDRLQKVMIDAGCYSFTQYFNYITQDNTGNAVMAMIDKVTTNHTFFMRESSHFDFFKSTVLPYLKATVSDRDLRIWCAASSTGEEPYTLAMILDEFFGADKLWWDRKILATDIADSVLKTAINGVYSNEKMEPLPDKWKQNYFKKCDEDHFVVKDSLKEEVIFRKFNLMENVFPFKKKFHVIFCRNVMIYFDQEEKLDLIQKFYNQMESGGYFFVGHSEAINRNETNFQYIMPSVYRKP